MKQQLCSCIKHFCTFLCRFCTTTTWNWLIQRFIGKRATTKFYFSFWTWKRFLGIQLQKGSPSFWQSKGVKIIAMKTERMQIHFLYNVFAAVASSDLKVLISCRQGWGSVLSTGGGGLANGRRRSELAGGSGAILPIYRIPCQEFGESHFPSSCQISYTVQKFSLFPKPHSISVYSRYPIILLQTLLNVYTAISRKVVEKMCTRQSRKVIWDMINTLFLTL